MALASKETIKWLLGYPSSSADLWNRVWKRARPLKELNCSQGTSNHENKEQGHPRRLSRQVGDADALGEGRTNPAKGIHGHLPRLEHLGSTTAGQGVGQTLNMTLLLADIKQWQHQHTLGVCVSPRRNGPLPALFSMPFVTSPHTITCAPPTTPTPNQFLGNYFAALNSQLMYLPAVRTSGLGGSCWDTPINPLFPRRGPSFPHGPPKLTNSEMLNPSCQPQNLRHQLTRVPSQTQFALQRKRDQEQHSLDLKHPDPGQDCGAGNTCGSHSEVSISRLKLLPSKAALFCHKVIKLVSVLHQ